MKNRTFRNILSLNSNHKKLVDKGRKLEHDREKWESVHKEQVLGLKKIKESLDARELNLEQREESLRRQQAMVNRTTGYITDLIHEQKKINECMGITVGMMDKVTSNFSKKEYLDLSSSRLILNNAKTVEALCDISNLRMEMFEFCENPNMFAEFEPDRIYPYRTIEKLYKSINVGFDVESRDFDLINKSYGYVRKKRILIIAFFILIENAWKYTIPDKKIDIIFNESDKKLTIDFCNWGPQLLPGELEKLTNREYRGDNANKGKFGGKGLGLSILKDILDICEITYSITTPDCTPCIYNNIPYSLFNVHLDFDSINTTY